MRRIILLLAVMVAPLQVDAEISQGAKIGIGSCGAILGTALGVYLHRKAGVRGDQLEVLRSLKSYLIEKSRYEKHRSRGLDFEKDLRRADENLDFFKLQLERLGLLDSFNNKNLFSVEEVQAVLSGIVSKWILFRALEVMAFGGAVAGLGFAAQGVYEKFGTKPVLPVNPQPEPQEDPQPEPQPQDDPQPQPELREDPQPELEPILKIEEDSLAYLDGVGDLFKEDDDSDEELEEDGEEIDEEQYQRELEELSTPN